MKYDKRNYAESSGIEQLNRVQKNRDSLSRVNLYLLFNRGEPTHINLEHLFEDLFKLKERFEVLGMAIKDGRVCLPDLDDA